MTSAQQRPGETINEFVGRLIAEHQEMAVALRDHNDALRSAHSVAERQGKETDWVSFLARTKRTLEAGHSASNLARLIAPQNQDT